MTQTRTQCRAGNECHPRTFDEAADCVGHHSANPLPVIAKLVNRAYSYLSKALSLNADQHPLRGDLIVPLTLASAPDAHDRNYALLDFLEAQVGRVAFVVPTATTATDHDAVTRTTRAVTEFGEMLATSGRVFADGVVTLAERSAFDREADEAIAAIAELKAYVAGWSQQQQPTELRAVR